MLMLLLLILPLYSSAQKQMTLKEGINALHEAFGVNFIYDSAIEPYVSCNAVYVGAEDSLESCLNVLLDGTGIRYDINNRYVVLKRKGRKPKDYVIFMEEQRDTLAESRITAVADTRKVHTQTGLTRIDAGQFSRGFASFSSPDLIKTLQNLPGVTGGTELLSGLHVHGGTGSDNLFLLDGVPLYQVSHLIGLFSSFNTDVVKSLDFYKSGFPARYGGRLSSVVDVSVRDGDFEEFHGTFSMGLIDGRFQLEGPLVKGKTSFNAALRRTWLDVVTIPMFAIINRTSSMDEQFGGRYDFWDGNARITHRFAKDNVLSLNFYMGRDMLNFGVETADEDYSRLLKNETGFNWGNIVTSLNWKYKISDALSSETVALFSQSRAKVFLSTVSPEFPPETELYTVLKENNYNLISDFGLKADFRWRPTDFHDIRFGGIVQAHFFRPHRENVFSLESPSGVLSEEYSSRKFYDGLEPAVYFEDEMSFSEKFKANVGFRYVLFGVKGKAWHRVEPRVALQWQFTDWASAKVSYSEMNQFSHLVASTYIDLPFNMWMPSTSVIPPSLSRQVAGGVYMTLPHNLRLNLEGYYRSMENIYEYAGVSTSLYPSLVEWEYSFREGRGRTYGLEAEFGWRTTRTDISTSYTLSWSERFFPDFWCDWYSDRNDNRHRFNVTASHRFSKRFEGYIGWNWRNGGWMTLPSHVDGDRYLIYTKPNNAQLPDYHRLDLGFNFRKTTRRGNESIWNLSIYNAYCRMNRFYLGVISSSVANGEYDENGWPTEYIHSFRGVQGGLIPIIPTFSYTLKF